MPAKKAAKDRAPGTVGTNVRRLREARSPVMPREELARLSGVSVSTISNIELGYVREPSIDNTRALAVALGVTDLDLLRAHGEGPIEAAIEAFLTSDASRRIPGGPVTDKELRYLRRFPTATWEHMPPTPETLYHIVMATRIDPEILDRD